MKLFKRELLRNPTDGAEYMDRFVIFDCRWFGIYLQRFLAPDWTRDPHDHPRHFVSFILSGWYMEEVHHRLSPIGPYYFFRNKYKMNSIPPERIHRIISLCPYEPTLTLCFVGPRVRRWGFFTKDGFVDSKVYLGQEDAS